MPFEPKPLPSAADIWERYSYDPLTGELHSRRHPKRKGFGYKDRSGYMATVVRWHGHTQNVMIHRLVWKWVTGEEPGETIDHIDRNRSNNRFWNLRVASWSTQMQNRDYTAEWSIKNNNRLRRTGNRFRRSATA